MGKRRATAQIAFVSFTSTIVIARCYQRVVMLRQPLPAGSITHYCRNCKSQ
jgi:hypothetical protein